MDQAGAPQGRDGGTAPRVSDRSTRIVGIVLILVGLGLVAFLLVAILP